MPMILDNLLPFALGGLTMLLFCGAYMARVERMKNILIQTARSNAHRRGYAEGWEDCAIQTKETTTIP